MCQTNRVEQEEEREVGKARAQNGDVIGAPDGGGPVGKGGAPVGIGGAIPTGGMPGGIGGCTTCEVIGGASLGRGGAPTDDVGG
mmetsp:Transcript_42032/g.63484  ORF Transcript_42032/g.63484 Transcript_42032/m.63484 type:complete len:84 (+) Transcript_42032:46-297(+)